MKNLILIFSAFLLAGCSNDDSSPNPVVNPAPPSPVRAKAAAFKAEDISGQVYSLRSELNFENGESQRETEFKGTALESETIVYSYTFRNQIRLSLEEIKEADSYCAVMTQASPTTPARDIHFSSSDRLRNGQLSQTLHNETFQFSLQLQAYAFQSFFLACKNVFHPEEVTAHIGHILNVQPRPAE